MPSLFCILKFLLIQHSHRFVAVVIQILIPFVPYVDRGNWEQEHVTEFCVLRRKFWQVSCLICSSRIQRCRSFSEKVGPGLIFLKSSQVSSCWKRSREVTTEPITVLTKIDSQWLHVATARRRCYYLERSKINHIAIK